MQVPDGKLGINILVQAAILKYYHCLPYDKIIALFKDLCGIEVSTSTIAKSLQRLSQWLKVEEEEILSGIRASPQVHIDETGWRINGKNHWLWAFVNKQQAYYKIEPSRGKKIVKKVLPDDFKGTIISDFYGVYFRLPYKRQKCLVHLLREFKRCQESDNSLEYQVNYKKIKRLINDSVRLANKHDEIKGICYQRRIRLIKKRLFLFMTYPYRNKNLKRLCKRFKKFWLDMFTFLDDPQVDWNNNLAERMIRPNVIYRNRSFGNRSFKAAKAHANLMSIIQTLIREQNVFESLKKAYIYHRQGNTAGFILK